MTVLLIGYGRCSSDQQDLTPQRGSLAAYGVAAHRVSVSSSAIGTFSPAVRLPVGQEWHLTK